MNRKIISFGKIALPKITSKSIENVEPSSSKETEGFSTFGKKVATVDEDIRNIAIDLESQHVESVMGIQDFGRKAKTFDLDQISNAISGASRLML